MSNKPVNTLYFVGSFLLVSAGFWKWGLKGNIANAVPVALAIAGLVMYFTAYRMDR